MQVTCNIRDGPSTNIAAQFDFQHDCKRHEMFEAWAIGNSVPAVAMVTLARQETRERRRYPRQKIGRLPGHCVLSVKAGTVILEIVAPWEDSIPGIDCARKTAPVQSITSPAMAFPRRALRRNLLFFADASARVWTKMAPRRRERWYSLDGQRRNHRAALESAQGPRRVISLVVLLVLTLIMIQQVSDVNRVARVATSIGLLPAAGTLQPPKHELTAMLSNSDNSMSASSTIPGNATSGTVQASTNPIDSGDPAGQSGTNRSDATPGPVAQNASTAPATNEAISDAMQREIATLTLHHPSAVAQLQSEVLQRLIQSAPKPLLESLIASWMELSDAPSAKASDPAVPEPSDTSLSDAGSQWLEKSLSTLQRWIELTDSTQSEHQVLLDLSRSLPLLLQPTPLQPTPLRPSQPVQPDGRIGPAAGFPDLVRLSLDRILLQSFLDNTPWRTSERLALARTTQRAAQMQQAFQTGWLAPGMIPGASVPLLVSQTSTLRGRGVRVSGTVARIDPPASLALANGLDMQYRVLWLRPDDASNQPIVIHLSNDIPVPAELLELDSQITVTGLLAKRRAYASSRGGEVAPVVIAADIALSPPVGLQPKPLTAFQQSALTPWSSAPLSSNWTPPLDLQSPTRLLQERLGPRLASLPPLPALTNTSTEAAPPSESDPQVTEAMQAFTLAEPTLATLLGLQKFSEEVTLLTQSQNRVALGDNQVLSEWSGWVTQVSAIPIEQPPFPGFDWKVIYALRLEYAPATIQDGTSPTAPLHSFVALTHQVPSSWLTSPNLRQPCIVRGLGLEPARAPLATGSDDNAVRTPPSLVLCASVAWQYAEPHSPTNKTANDSLDTSLAPPLPLGWQSLLQHSWDLGWIDMLESLHGQPMTSRESHAFYAMLAASSPSATLPHPIQQQPHTPTLSMMTAIQRSEASKRKKGSVPDSERCVGYRVNASVTVRRVQRIEVTDPKRIAWLGSNAYFQIDGLADIGRNRIEIKYGPETEPVVFQSEFPVTLVAKHVPDWLLIDSGDADPTGSQVWYPRIRTETEGWFYRIWKYKTPQISAATDDTQSQQGPMLVVDRIELATIAPSPVAEPNAIPWTSIATTLLGFAAIAWFAYRMQLNPSSQRKLQKHSFRKPPTDPGRS
jgi:hypothetical protein